MGKPSPTTDEDTLQDDGRKSGVEAPRVLAVEAPPAMADANVVHDDLSFAQRRTRREILKWADVLLTPVVVALVGAFGSFWIAHRQEQSSRELQKSLQEAQSATALLLQTNQARASENLQNVQLASAERIAQATQHAKLLEIFTAQIVSPSAAARANAVRLLRAVDPELGAKLAEGVAADESQPAAVRQEAKMVFQGLKKSPSSLFTSVPDSCRSAPTATRFNGQLDQDQANKECERAASRGGPKLSDGTWTWKPKFNGIELTCTCISRGGNDDSSK